MIEHQWEPDGLVRRHVGTVFCHEIAQSDAAIQADPRFQQVKFVIDDFRRCSSLKGPEDEGVMVCTEPLCTGMPALWRHAVVLTTPLFHKAIAVLNRIGHPAVQPFVFMADARDWATP